MFANPGRDPMQTVTFMKVYWPAPILGNLYLKTLS